MPRVRIPADELAAFAASPPPREIPPGVRRARVPNGPIVLAVSIFVASLGLFALLAPRLFPTRIVEDLRLEFMDPWIVTGEIVSVEDTDTTKTTDGGPVKVQRYTISYLGDGQDLIAECFAVGVPVGAQGEPTIEMLRSDPQVARLVGSRRSEKPLSAFFLVLMPFVPFLWLMHVRGKRRRALSLLRDGRFEFARVGDPITVRPPGAAGAEREEWPLHIDEEPGARPLMLRPTPAEAEALARARTHEAAVGVLFDRGRSLVLDAVAEQVPADEPEDEDPYA